MRAESTVVINFFREKWQRQAACGSVWQWHQSVSGLGRKRGVIVAVMPVNSTPLECDANLTAGLGARDVFAGPDAMPPTGIC